MWVSPSRANDDATRRIETTTCGQPTRACIAPRVCPSVRHRRCARRISACRKRLATKSSLATFPPCHATSAACMRCAASIKRTGRSSAFAACSGCIERGTPKPERERGMARGMSGADAECWGRAGAGHARVWSAVGGSCGASPRRAASARSRCAASSAALARSVSSMFCKAQRQQSRQAQVVLSQQRKQVSKRKVCYSP